MTETELIPGAVRVGKWKAIWNIRTGWKGAEEYTNIAPEMFDLWNHPGERYDSYLQSGVIGSRLGEAAVIPAAAEGWLSSTSDNSTSARLLRAGEVGRQNGRGARVVVDRGA
jgi:hypothetical protein